MSSDESTATFAGVGTAQLREDPTLSDSDDRTEPYTIHGVALGVGDVTVGQSGTKKFWPADELRKAAATLVGQPLVRDHRNTTAGKVGEVTEAQFVQDVGIVYEAEIAPHYEQLANDIRAGLMEVSIRAYHAPESELETTADGALRVQDVYFDNLSVVNDGASPSNSARVGSVDNHPAVSEASAVVSQATTHGGQSVATLERSVSDTAMEDALSFTAEDAPDSDHPHSGLRDDWDEDENSDPCESGYVQVGMKEMDGRQVPRCVPEEEADQMDVDGDTDTESLANIPGTYTADGTVFAVAPDEHDDDSTEHADDAKYPLTSCTGENSIEAAWNLRSHGDYNIDQSTLESRIRSAAESMDCDAGIVGADSLAANGGEYTPTEGDWVVWQAKPEMGGKVVHVDDDRHIAMVDVYDSADPDADSTGHTVSAGYPDIVPADSSEQSQTRTGVDSDADTDELERPSASMDELDEVYSDWDDAVNMTASELEQWADNPCAEKASVDSNAVIERNLRLLETPKSEWDTDDIGDAKRTISFVQRMSSEQNEPQSPRDGPHGCPSKWAISLLNWAYNPFDSIPDVPDELQDEMASDESESETEAELAEYGPDHDDAFEDESDAASRAMELGLDGETHEHEEDGETYYMPGADMGEYEDAIEEASYDDEKEEDDEEEEASYDDDDTAEKSSDDYDEDEDEDEEEMGGHEDDEDEDEDDEEEMSSRIVPVASLDSDSLSADASVEETTDMIDYEPATEADISDELSEPVVVERDALEDLGDKAEAAENVEAELSTLTERLEENDEASEVLSELSDDERDLLESDTDATVVEASAADMFDEVQRIYAEELSEYAPFSADELADRFSPTELKDRVEEHDEAELSSSIEDTEVEPDAGSVSEEELADNEANEAEEELREKMAAELEDKGWDAQAEKVRSGEIDPVRTE